MKHARVAVLILLAFVGLCLLGAASASAQSAFSEDINDTFGTGLPNDGFFTGIDEKSDGGFALSGRLDGSEMWLLTTDEDGNEVLNKTFGGADNDRANSVIQTPSGGFALAGTTGVFSSSDGIFIKTDSNGNVVTNKKFGGAADDGLESVIRTSDGGFAFAGWTSSFGSAQIDSAWLIKTDDDGNEQWNKTYTEGDFNRALSLVQTDDNDFVLAGQAGPTSSETDALLIRTDNNGNVDFAETIGPENSDTDDKARSVIQTSDGGLAFAGKFGDEGFSGSGEPDAWLVKRDSSGNIVINETFGGSDSDEARSLVEESDGDLALAGETVSFSGGTRADLWLIKTDANGNKELDETYGGSDRDIAASLVEVREGGTLGFGFGGSADSFGKGGGWLLKITDISPTVSIDSLPGSADEGESVTLEASFDDPGPGDEYTATIDWGDGETTTLSESDIDQTNEEFSATHAYDDDGSYTVTVTVFDGDEGSGQDTASLTVNNVAPDVTIDSLPGSVDEDDAVSLDASFDDPGTADTHTATVDWGDGTTESVTVDQASNTLSSSHTYEDDGSYTVTVTVEDDDGGVGTDTATVNVENVAPDVTIDSLPGSVDESEVVSLNASFDDPGNDTHTATIDWDDGTTEPISVDQTNETLSATHTYYVDVEVSYTVTVTVTDDDGGTGTANDTVKVDNLCINRRSVSRGQESQECPRDHEISRGGSRGEFDRDTERRSETGRRDRSRNERRNSVR